VDRISRTANSTIDAARGFDFVAGDADARDPLDPPNAGHGTSTASVLLSDANPSERPRVQGVAPLATLVPLRVSNSVVHFSWARLTAALWRAIEGRSHVVSMSLGGPLPSFALHEAIEEAVDAESCRWRRRQPVSFVAIPRATTSDAAPCASIVSMVGFGVGKLRRRHCTGESVWRTWPPGGWYRPQSGHSYAAAHVAGIVAPGWSSRTR
jgi:thermitase